MTAAVVDLHNLAIVGEVFEPTKRGGPLAAHGVGHLAGARAGGAFEALDSRHERLVRIRLGPITAMPPRLFCSVHVTIISYGRRDNAAGVALQPESEYLRAVRLFHVVEPRM